MRTKPIRMNSIILSLCEIVIGVLLLINPVSFTVGIVTFLGIVLLLAGIVSVVQYFREKPEVAAIEHSLTRGIIEIAARRNNGPGGADRRTESEFSNTPLGILLTNALIGCIMTAR